MAGHRWSPTCAVPRGLVHPVPVDPTRVAGPTPDQARGPRWRRTTRGLYVPAEVDGSRTEQRVVEQAARLPPGGAVTGWAALRLAGATFFDGIDRDGRTMQPVPLAVGDHKIRTASGTTVSREPLPPAEVVLRQGVRCTRPERAVLDEMRRVEDWREAVVVADMAAAAGLVSLRMVEDFRRDRSSWRRATRVPRALRFASELSRSPNETRLRLVWVLDAGLPGPMVNPQVLDRDGRLVAVVDLLDPVAGLVGEFDGAEHRGSARHQRDVAREDALRRLGLEVVTVTGPDLLRRPAVVERVLAARDRARFEPERERAWIARRPPGPSLDDELDTRRVLSEIYALRAAEQRGAAQRPGAPGAFRS